MSSKKTNNWKNIWNKNERLNLIILDCLIKADGFDSGAGKFNVKDWKSYVNKIYKILEINSEQSIFEVGCGSGAFLYPHYLNKGKVGGIDYSNQLIQIAKNFMKKSDFKCLDAEDICTSKKYDICLSNSVFQYFSSYDQAEKIIQKMISKSVKQVAILDVNDKKYFDIYHRERVKMFERKGFSKSQYNEKYTGLDHFFYEKDFFKLIAKKNKIKITILPQEIQNYGNSKFRYNVFFKIRD